MPDKNLTTFLGEWARQAKYIIEGLKPLNQSTVPEMLEIIRAGKAQQAWSVGDTIASIPIKGSCNIGYTTNADSNYGGTRWYTSIDTTLEITLIDFDHNISFENPDVEHTATFMGKIVGTRNNKYSGDVWAAIYHSAIYFSSNYNWQNGTPNGYLGSDLKTSYESLYSCLPTDWQTAILTTTKGCCAGKSHDSIKRSDPISSNGSRYRTTISTKVFPFSEKELTGVNSYSDVTESNDQRYSYFSKGNALPTSVITRTTNTYTRVVRSNGTSSDSVSSSTDSKMYLVFNIG